MKIFLLIVSFTFAPLIAAVCCPKTVGRACPDGKGDGTWDFCCGCGSCNIMCCNCDDGCRQAHWSCALCTDDLTTMAAAPAAEETACSDAAFHNLATTIIPGKAGPEGAIRGIGLPQFLAWADNRNEGLMGNATSIAIAMRHFDSYDWNEDGVIEYEEMHRPKNAVRSKVVKQEMKV